MYLKFVTESIILHHQSTNGRFSTFKGRLGMHMELLI
jgi:hypothetical protein